MQLSQAIVLQLRNLLQLDSLPKIADQNISAAVTNHFLAAANKQIQTTPQLVIIGGGPGVGKSLFYENLKVKKQLPAHAVLHDPDLVMQAIPDYQADAKKNPVKAFQKWELPARQLANEILLTAFIARHNIVYMRTFALSNSLKFVRCAKELGYKIYTHMLICKQEVALARAHEREKITKRHIPAEVLLQRHAAVVKLLPAIAEVSDCYFLYENNEDGVEPVLKL